MTINFSNTIYYGIVLLLLLLLFASSLHITSDALNSNYKDIPTDQSLVIESLFSPYTGVSIGLFTRSLLNYAIPEIAKEEIKFTIG